MKLRLAMNPGSRSGRGRRLWQAWAAGLEAAGAEVDLRVTERPGHAFEIAREATGVDAVVAVGGDGTINEVLDGLLQNPVPGLALGVLYSGTSPDFCRFHRIPTDPGQALARLLRGRRRQVDAVRIDYQDAGGQPRTSHFACSCNIGLGAEIAGTSNRIRRYFGDAAGTGLAAFRAILRCPRNDLECEIDGERIPLAQVNNLSILKNPWIASGLKLNLDLQPDDGRLFAVGVQGRGRLGLLALLPSFYTGRAAIHGGLWIRPCSTLRLVAARPQELEFDGDPRGFLPVRLRLLPRALTLIGGSDE